MDERRGDRAFTLIELLVVTGIMVVVSGIILASNSQYGGKVLLQNFAYDLALSIRQAQVYGISVQRFGSGESANFSNGYGMHFDLTSASNATSYLIFADAITVNGLYDGVVGCPQSTGSGTEFVQCSSIGRGYAISKLCAPAGADATLCTEVNRLDILFKRPEPDACISANSISNVTIVNGVQQCAPIYSSARIVVRSPRGDTMSISVQANGQIAVDQKPSVSP